jgi:hypothetical protein
MSNWVQLTDVKSYLWITDSSSDDKLNLLIPAVQKTLINVIGDISQSDKTEQISCCDINSLDWSFYVSNSNVTTIKAIDWTSYVWVLNIDYMIRFWRKIFINNLATLIDTTKQFNFFDITYTSGYSTIPSDLQLLMYIMIAWEMNRDWGKEVSSYKVWDVSINYVSSESSPLIIQSILWNYKLASI